MSTNRDEKKALEHDLEEVKKASEPADGAKHMIGFIKETNEPLEDFENGPWNFKPGGCACTIS
jgi:hypothetical protein